MSQGEQIQYKLKVQFAERLKPEAHFEFTGKILRTMNVER